MSQLRPGIPGAKFGARRAGRVRAVSHRADCPARRDLFAGVGPVGRNLILVIAAVFHPFLEINEAGIVNRVSLLDVATSFRSGVLVVVSVASVAMIVLVPLLRTALLVYVIAPLTRANAPWPGARIAFRWAQEMKPWAMTEIFIIGCAVALVKVADLARLQFGLAFWLFIALAVFVVVVDRMLCAWSVWSALDEADAQRPKP